MKTLYLHVGHGKTGSSFIQSTLVNSTKSLSALGIYYPLPQNADAAALGKTSTGNGWYIINDTFRDLNLNEVDDSILLSSEFLFGFILNNDGVRKINEFVDHYHVRSVKILLFIRDPIEHISSSYSQMIKSEGYARDIDEFAINFDMPKEVVRFLDVVSGIRGVELTVRNYSRVKDSLILCFSRWLNVDSAVFVTPRLERVNRSLTAGELVFQKALNAVLGADANLLALALCDELPHIKSEEVRPSLKVQEACWEHIKECVDRVNMVVDEFDQYHRDVSYVEASGNARYCFSTEQLVMIADMLGSEIARLKKLDIQ
jgi:hypothetical protein